MANGDPAHRAPTTITSYTAGRMPTTRHLARIDRTRRLSTWSSRAPPPGGWRFEDEARSHRNGIRAGPCAARRAGGGGGDADAGDSAADLCGVLAAQAREALLETLRQLLDHDRDVHR